jgi:hypothetical protein
VHPGSVGSGSSLCYTYSNGWNDGSTAVDDSVGGGSHAEKNDAVDAGSFHLYVFEFSIRLGPLLVGQ